MGSCLFALGLTATSALSAPAAHAQMTYAGQFGSSGSAPGQFNEPPALAVDNKGFVYVVDQFNGRVEKFSSTGTFLSVFASGVVNGQTMFPGAVAVDPSDNVYVFDQAQSRVLKFDSNGNFVREFGSRGSSTGQFGSQVQIAVDGAGNLYATDNDNNRVEKFDVNGNFVSLIGAPGMYSSIAGIAVDTNGDVFVVDPSLDTVSKFDNNGNLILQFAASGGPINFPGIFPWAITVDLAGHIYVTDDNTNSVSEYSSTGAYLFQVGGFGWGPSEFEMPNGIAFDGKHTLYVVDSPNDRVELFTVSSVVPPGVTPNQIPVGSSDTTITITGSGFVASSVASFGGTSLATTFISSSQLTAVVPASLLLTFGIDKVTVAVPGVAGSRTIANVAVTNPRPVAISVTPSTVPIGTTGQQIDIAGSNFIAATQVTFNGTPLTVSNNTGTDLQLLLTNALLAVAGIDSIKVTNPGPGGGSAIKTLTFTVTVSPTTLTNISPASAPVGSGDVQITLTGTNFYAQSSVIFNHTPLATTFTGDPTTLTAIIPAANLAAAGKFPVIVRTNLPGGGTSAGIDFQVTNPAPTVSAVSPNTAVEQSGDTPITITGTNFVAGSKVAFNGRALTATVVDATDITATIPHSLLTAIGTFPVTVTNPAPGGGSASASFTVNPFVLNQSSIVLLGTPTVTKHGSTLFVTATVENIGNYAARAFHFVSGSLNGVAGSGVGPSGPFTFAAGATTTAQFMVPASAAASGSIPTVTLSYASTNVSGGGGTLTATGSAVP